MSEKSLAASAGAWTPNEAVAFLNRALDRWAEQSGTSVSIEAGNVVGLRDFIIEWSRRDAVASSCAAARRAQRPAPSDLCGENGCDGRWRCAVCGRER